MKTSTLTLVLFLLLLIEASQAAPPKVVPGNGIRFKANKYGATNCSIGPAVKWANNGALGFITCGGLAVGTDVYQLEPDKDVEVGTVVDNGPEGSSFYSIVQLAEKVKLEAGVNLYNGKTRTIKKYRVAVIGLIAHQSGAASQVEGAVVQSLTAEKTLPNGAKLKNLLKTNACSAPGDEGAPLYGKDSWLGVLVGGIGGDNCETSRSFHHKIDEILNRHSLEVYTG